mmetsp:Transcript_44050/g.111447  ORF Transcript_44050/g.111447 Transcript_44050/m.111447 type:complete len:242 (+) Transcript_44050:1208-1933(+)
MPLVGQVELQEVVIAMLGEAVLDSVDVGGVNGQRVHMAEPLERAAQDVHAAEHSPEDAEPAVQCRRVRQHEGERRHGAVGVGAANHGHVPRLVGIAGELKRHRLLCSHPLHCGQRHLARIQYRVDLGAKVVADPGDGHGVVGAQLHQLQHVRHCLRRLPLEKPNVYVAILGLKHYHVATHPRPQGDGRLCADCARCQEQQHQRQRSGHARVGVGGLASHLLVLARVAWWGWRPPGCGCRPR